LDGSLARISRSLRLAMTRIQLFATFGSLFIRPVAVSGRQLVDIRNLGAAVRSGHRAASGQQHRSDTDSKPS
jgi:hypothetical protein